jgi:predicted RNA-binding Zn ribbon-like protein
MLPPSPNIPGGTVTSLDGHAGNILIMPEPARRLADLDLVGGNPSLDFANSINSRIAPVHDYLASDGLFAWAEHAGLMSTEGGRPPSFEERAVSDRSGADRAPRVAHGLREAIYATFSAIAASAAAPSSAVRRVLRAYGQAVGRGALADLPDGPRLQWSPPSNPTAVLDRVAFAAGELLLARNRPPIKECPGCGWLFLDRSRNGSRRWCDMQVCGSRDKMRRYHRSRRAGPAQRRGSRPQKTSAIAGRGRPESAR